MSQGGRSKNMSSNPHDATDTLISFPQYEKALELYEEGQNTQAQKLLNELLQTEEFPDKHVCWYLKGQIFLEDGEAKDALECMRKADSLGHVDAKNLIRRVTDGDEDLDEDEQVLREYLRKEQQ